MRRRRRFDPYSAAAVIESTDRIARAMRDSMPRIDERGRLRPSRATERSLRYRIAHALRALRGDPCD